MNYPSGSDFGYEYDGVGNRTKMHEYTTSTITTTYTYDAADELTGYTTSTLTVSFVYASDGCSTSKSDGFDTHEYVWDQERRLAAFKKNSSTLVEYGYNPTGTRRFASDTSSGVENYFCAGSRVLGDYDSNWALTTSYVHGVWRDETVCMLDRTTDPNAVHYFTSDRISSTRDLLSSSETPETRYDYDAWGDPAETHLSGSVSTRFRARGRLYSETSELGVTAGGWYSAPEGRRLATAQARTDAPRVALWSHFYSVQPAPVDLRISCFEVCTAQRQQCQLNCWRPPSACLHHWTMGLCGRCCQCWAKRCSLGCMDLDSHPNGRIKIWYDLYTPDWQEPGGGWAFPGPPAWGDNWKSQTECRRDTCAWYNFTPATYQGEKNDQSVTAHNVCASLLEIHKEWNLYWYKLGVLVPAIDLPSGKLCNGCIYWGISINSQWPVPVYRSQPDWKRGPICTVNQNESCPPFIPVYYGPYGGAYYPTPPEEAEGQDPETGNVGEWRAWNSCPRDW